jgi:ribosomal protein L12E/L44/L45/RPP1/RPP2
VALSKTQNRRLGALLSVMFAEELTEDDLKEVLKDNFVQEKEGQFKITQKGLDEKNRLCTLAGLNIKYQSETQ